VVKERRELMADLEAAQQMDDLWGTEGCGGRAKQVASMKEPSDDDEDGDGE
jgi:hypothetical protein